MRGPLDHRCSGGISSRTLCTSHCTNPSTVCMLRRHIVLLIAIRPLDGDIKPGGPLGAFQEEQAMSRHRVSPSPFLSSSSHTTQTVTHTVTLTSTSYNTVQILFPHVMWSAHAVRDSKIDQTQRHLSALRVIVQWVGIGTHTHFRITGLFI